MNSTTPLFLGVDISFSRISNGNVWPSWALVGGWAPASSDADTRDAVRVRQRTPTRSYAALRQEAISCVSAAVCCAGRPPLDDRDQAEVMFKTSTRSCRACRSAQLA
jgi:hypothetical protein